MSKMGSNDTCEACEESHVDVVESCDCAESPYRLCWSCHDRLHSRSLRPLEWYNLAKRHGWWQFLLHDDFYDEDGTATCPESEVVEARRYPIPRLAEVADDPDRLLDFTITRWGIDPALENAWNQHPPADILAVLSNRFARTGDIGIASTVLNVAAMLKQEGAEFVRYAWCEYPDKADLQALAYATALCLPRREGFDRVVEALCGMGEPEQRQLMLSLSHFHSPDALDWIERHARPPVTESWGNLAAASQLDWPRVVQWLNGGRPLSLVALDALGAVIRPMTPLLRSYGPHLHDPPDSAELHRVLNSHLARDRAPRVKMMTAAILKNEAILLGNAPANDTVSSQ